MRKAILILVITVICVFMFVPSVNAFKLNLINDSRDTAACLVFRIGKDPNSPDGSYLKGVFRAKLRPKTFMVVDEDKKPGKYLIRWISIFYVNKPYDIHTIVNVAEGVSEIASAPLSGIGCINCDKKQIQKGIWEITPKGGI